MKVNSDFSLILQVCWLIVYESALFTKLLKGIRDDLGNSAERRRIVERSDRVDDILIVFIKE